MLPGLGWRSIIIDAPLPGSHVPGGELVPGAGEHLIECCSVLGELLDNLHVLLIPGQSNVTGEETNLNTVIVISSGSCGWII